MEIAVGVGDCWAAAVAAAATAATAPPKRVRREREETPFHHQGDMMVLFRQTMGNFCCQCGDMQRSHFGMLARSTSAGERIE